MKRNKWQCTLTLLVLVSLASACEKTGTTPSEPDTRSTAASTDIRSAPEPASEPSPAVPQPIDMTDAAGHAYHALCDGEVTDLADVLEPIARNMTAQKIPYTRDPANEWRDCSGNFLRLSSYVASACPDQQEHLIAPPGIKDYAPGGDNVAPGNVTVRSSRGVAKWFNDRGRFTPIYYDDAERLGAAPKDLHAYRDYIRPGAVLWFSRGKPLRTDGIDALFVRNEANSHINHMATVTAVVRDDSGQVMGYSMYHGRTKSKPGSVTKAHFWTWPEKYLQGGKEYPPLGYWKQRLVGISTLVPVVASR